MDVKTRCFENLKIALKYAVLIHCNGAGLRMYIRMRTLNEVCTPKILRYWITVFSYVPGS